MSTAPAPGARPASAVRRVVVAGDVHRSPAALIDLAARLATRLNAELGALYVEDLDLLHSAALPFTREIGLVTRGELDVGEIARALRRDASRIEQAIAAAAARQNVKWTFEVEQGRLLARALARPEASELVVVAARGDAPSAAGSPILVVETVASGAEREREFAMQLLDVPASRLAVRGPVDLANAARELRPCIIVVPSGFARTIQRDLTALLRTAGCGLILTS